jgi:tryptophan synthase alpha chain
LPLAVGFGIKTAAQVAEIGKLADAAVVGSAIVSRIAAGLDAETRPHAGLTGEILAFVRELAGGLRVKER